MRAYPTNSVLPMRRKRFLRYKAGPISSAYVLQDEVTALKAENERMKQHDLELTAKYDQVQRDNEEMKAQIALLMQQAGLTK